MATLEILKYPDARLRRVAQPVTVFDDALAQLAADMAETMYSSVGIGLAAAQVNVLRRVVVMDVSEQKNDLQIFINPEISDCAGNAENEEGCLSVPGTVGMVARAKTVTINAQDVKGNSFEITADEILSVCIQHEIDHLDGKLFIDYLSRMKRDRIHKKLKKEAHTAKAESAEAESANRHPPNNHSQGYSNPNARPNPHAAHAYAAKAHSKAHAANAEVA